MGSPLKGKNILVVDDVVTAGTAMTEAIKLVEDAGGKVVAFIVALDRMERMPSAREKEGKEEEAGAEVNGESAMGLIRRQFGIRTASVVTLDDLILLLKEKGGEEGVAERIVEYRERYKSSD